MASPLLIIGQGLAGTMLAWELESNGADFRIIDRGHEQSASRVAAGIINPITGQRLVSSWQVRTALPLAREAFAAVEARLGVRIWREMRVRRDFANDVEKRVFLEKRATGELAPFVVEADEDGFWIEQAACVDVAGLLMAARNHWKSTGRLVERSATAVDRDRGSQDLVILCGGAELLAQPELQFVPWTVAKGEILTVSISGLADDVILNRGMWALPVPPGGAKIGATYTPGATDLFPTPAAREELKQAARHLLGRPFEVQRHEAGLRVTLPDKRPVVGRVPAQAGLGVFGGLGSKGALLAPWLARQWWNHLSEGVPFDRAVDVARFWRPQPTDRTGV